MVCQVPLEMVWQNLDIVIHEKDNLAGRLPNTAIPRRRFADDWLSNPAQVWRLRGQSSKDLDGVISRTVVYKDNFILTGWQCLLQNCLEWN